jgi:membrane protein required for colicin V production
MLQSYDLLMLLVLGAATAFGAWKGLAWQVASLASIFLSYVLAVKFRGPVAAAIDAQPPWNMFLAMLILYVGASLVIWILFRFVRKSIDRLRLKEFDRQIGALVGLAKGVLLCVIITLFAVTLTGDQRRQAIVNSNSGYYIAVLLDRSHAIMPPEVHEVLAPYIHKLDERLDSSRYAHDHGAAATTSGQSPLPSLGGPLFGQPSADPQSTGTWNPNSSGGNSGGLLWPPPPASIPSGGSTDSQGPLDRLRDWGQDQLRNQARQQLDQLLPPPSR